MMPERLTSGCGRFADELQSVLLRQSERPSENPFAGFQTAFCLIYLWYYNGSNGITNTAISAAIMP